ncbi:hypothetical protein CEUSTIGMA_g14049.t1, partial [Chlamydomonas eustigma]
ETAGALLIGGAAVEQDLGGEGSLHDAARGPIISSDVIHGTKKSGGSPKASWRKAVEFHTTCTTPLLEMKSPAGRTDDESSSLMIGKWSLAAAEGMTDHSVSQAPYYSSACASMDSMSAPAAIVLADNEAEAAVHAGSGVADDAEAAVHAGSGVADDAEAAVHAGSAAYHETPVLLQSTLPSDTIIMGTTASLLAAVLPSSADGCPNQQIVRQLRSLDSNSSKEMCVQTTPTLLPLLSRTNADRDDKSHSNQEVALKSAALCISSLASASQQTTPGLLANSARNNMAFSSLCSLAGRNVPCMNLQYQESSSPKPVVTEPAGQQAVSRIDSNQGRVLHIVPTLQQVNSVTRNSKGHVQQSVWRGGSRLRMSDNEETEIRRRADALKIRVSPYFKRPSGWAHPDVYVRDIASTCTDQPLKAYGYHGAPKQDPLIQIQLLLPNNTALAPNSSLCPGSTYLLQVLFGGEAREALVTSNSGTFSSANSADPLKCLNRFYSSMPALNASSELYVPCQNVIPG